MQEQVLHGRPCGGEILREDGTSDKHRPPIRGDGVAVLDARSAKEGREDKPRIEDQRVAHGGKLFADFVDVPRVVYDAIKTGRYKHVSIIIKGKDIEEE